jgi:phosphopantothenoylcysteine decarboxylase/phosphopantothenate--cysteine ligase
VKPVEQAGRAPDPGAFAGRRVIVGLSGGIACYKVASVVSALAQAGADVTVAMTEAATRFVGPLTFQALSGRPVYTSQWEHVEAHDPQHVALARTAEAVLVAPCSMDMVAKLVAGRTDDVVSLIVSAVDLGRQPVLLAPSMNAVMYAQPSTQRNLRQLAEDGFRVIDPAFGWQACRTEGPGRLPEPEELLVALAATLSQPAAGRGGGRGRAGT